MFWKVVSGAWAGIKVVGEVTVGTAKVAATAGAVVKDFVVEHKEEIKGGLAGAAKITAEAIEVGGRLTKEGLRNGKDALIDMGRSSDSTLVKAAAYGTAAVAAAGELAGAGTEMLGKGTRAVADPVGAAVGSAIVSTTAMASNAADSVAVSKTDIERLRKRLIERGEVITRRSERVRGQLEEAARRRKRETVIDYLVVGGVSLSAVVGGGKVPKEVEAAFQAAYPGLASTETFADAAARLPADQLEGLVGGVKGKLFELKFVEELNNGGLPDGFVARLADSANQQGWDIQIIDPSGRVSEVLQAKATESVSYVNEALAQYPGIDVVTTSETFASLMAAGAAESVRNGGISEAALDAVVSGAAGIGASFDVSDLAPSALGLAVIALSAFMDRTKTAEERAAAFGERAGRASIASALGHGVMLATNTWWLALIGGVGSHWLAANGRAKREQLNQLEAMLKDLNRAERRMQRLLPAPTH